MLNRRNGLLLVLFIQVALLTGTVVAQDRQVLGKFTDFYGNSTVKEVGATGTEIQLQESWLGQNIYKGDELTTGYDSYIQIMIESTVVELFEKSHAVVESTEEGLYLVNFDRGEMTALIDSDLFQIKVLNQTVYKKNTKVNLKIMPNNDIVVTSLRDACYIDNEYGATFIIPERQSATIMYDRLTREYIFRPSFTNTQWIGVRPKGEKEVVKIRNDEKYWEYLINEDGKGELREIEDAGPEELEPPKKKVRNFSMHALLRYDWFESDKEIYWYRGEKEQFKATSAWLGIGTQYKFAEVFLSVDAVKDKVLNELWAELFIPEKRDIIKFRMGQMRIPFGFQPTRRLDELHLLEYSQAVKYAFSSTLGDPASSDLDYLFDIGFLLSGRMELLTNTYFEYSCGVFNGESRITSETNFSKTLIARGGFNFSDKFIFGGSTYDGETTVGNETYGRLRNGVDVRIQGGDFILQAEYIWAYDNINPGKKSDLTEGICIDLVFGLGLVAEGLQKVKLVGRYDVFLPPYGLVEPGFEDQHVKSTIAAFGFAWQVSDEVKFTAVFESLSQGEERYAAPLEKSEADQRAIFQFNISF